MTDEEREHTVRVLFAEELARGGYVLEARVILSKDYMLLGGVFAAALSALRRAVDPKVEAKG